jgi:hypothetical protein
MSISTKIIKKILFTVSFMFTTFFTLTSYGQTFQSDMANLTKQSIDWYVLNTPNFLKKTPLKVSDLTPAHLSDSTTPNSIEINEINKSIQQRDRNRTVYAQIVRKYIKLPEAAEAMVKNSKDFETSMITTSIQLREGKINFGQYNQEKQKLVAQVIANGNAIIQKYDLKSQLSGGQAPQQKPQASKPTPQGMTANDLVNFKNNGAAIGSCYGLMQGTIGRGDLAYDGMSIIDFHTKFGRLDKIVPDDQKLESNALFNETMTKSLAAPAAVVNKAIQMCLRLIN